MKKNVMILCAMLSVWPLSELVIDHNDVNGTTSIENEASDCYVTVTTDEYNATIALLSTPAEETAIGEEHLQEETQP